jgi:hypothetical protein
MAEEQTMTIKTVENPTPRLAQFRRFQLCVNLPDTADFCGCGPEEPENIAKFHAGNDLFGKTRKGGVVLYPFGAAILCLRRAGQRAAIEAFAPLARDYARKPTLVDARCSDIARTACLTPQVPA